MTWQQLDMAQLEIPLKEVYSFMGFGSAEPDDATRSVTETLLEESRQFIKPEFKYLEFDGSLSDDFLQLTIQGPEGPVAFNAGKIICRQLRGAEKFIAFVASVGHGYYKWMDLIVCRGDVLQTYVSDCIGSQIVESATDYMETVLQQELDPRGFKRTNRFSPGYCGWHVKEQSSFFSLFQEPEPCGIHLTDSCLMMPVKSVSGIIGIGSDVRYLPYSCNICTMQMCYKRRR